MQRIDVAAHVPRRMARIDACAPLRDEEDARRGLLRAADRAWSSLEVVAWLSAAPCVVSVTSDETTTTVRVSDEGIGLDGHELAQLFGRGYRAQSARTVRGAGLGLYLSNGLIAAHGGRMWAESAGHGHGSTFCFSMPLRLERGGERALTGGA